MASAPVRGGRCFAVVVVASFRLAGAGVFFGATIAAEPIVYDPGTTVIYEGDTYYVDGEPSGTAAAARQQAIQLANPAVAEIPVPDPAPEGQPETWLPLGVWALTRKSRATPPCSCNSAWTRMA